MYTLYTRMQHNLNIKLDPEDLKKFGFKIVNISGGRGDGYLAFWYKGKNVMLHRVIMNAKDTEIVDHINGNTLDNRKINLRVCSHRQNIINSKPRSDNTSGYKGVFRNRATNLWEARVGNVFAGSYTYKTEAAVAYNKAAIKLHGEYNRLNYLPLAVI
jgi:hypothetical protein